VSFVNYLYLFVGLVSPSLSRYHKGARKGFISEKKGFISLKGRDYKLRERFYKWEGKVL
jgi:hypothetical protein